MSRDSSRSVAWMALAACTIHVHLLHADDATSHRERQREMRLKYLMQKAEAFQISVAGQPNAALALDENPVLRYTNPVRNFFTDGVVFLWRHDSKPALLGALSVRGDGNVFCEFASLSSLPLHCDLGIRRAWTPDKNTQVDVPLKTRVPFAKDQRRQALAMRQLIRRFSVWMHEADDPDKKKELRLLSNPLVQWSDTASESSAMCFAFTETNDPEALILLRYNSISKTGDDPWTYTLSRMTSRPLVFEFDGQVIHEVKSYWQNPQSDQDSYLERRLGEYSTD